MRSFNYLMNQHTYLESNNVPWFLYLCFLQDVYVYLVETFNKCTSRYTATISYRGTIPGRVESHDNPSIVILPQTIPDTTFSFVRASSRAYTCFS